MGYDRIVTNYGFAGRIGGRGVRVPTAITAFNLRGSNQMVPLIASVLGKRRLAVPIGDSIFNMFGL